VSVGIQGAVSGVHFSANAPVPVSVSPDILPSTGSIASAVVARQKYHSYAFIPQACNSRRSIQFE